MAIVLSALGYGTEVSCMCKYIKVLILTIILSLMICTPGMAKTMQSNDGRFKFTTPDNWYLTSVGGGDSITDEVLTVTRDAATVVTLKQSNVAYNYRTFRECSYAEKSIIRDNAIRQIVNYFQPMGFEVRVNRADIFDEAIAIAYHIFKDGRKYYTLQNFVMKNYILYSLTLTASEYTVQEASGVFASLTADGLPYAQWVK